MFSCKTQIKNFLKSMDKNSNPMCHLNFDWNNWDSCYGCPFSLEMFFSSSYHCDHPAFLWYFKGKNIIFAAHHEYSMNLIQITGQKKWSFENFQLFCIQLKLFCYVEKNIFVWILTKCNTISLEMAKKKRNEFKKIWTINEEVSIFSTKNSNFN